MFIIRSIERSLVSETLQFYSNFFQRKNVR